ncbi:GNAT family N-acetyltransferase [Paraburkholderia humisilvae]|uniref:N-acetyltransferase domain-containing protein n=1 Tax=Paraburkholderia humisilvae TaxID=627669 RepID=A0A6J5DMA7_9BURK|nr:GNAT family N-acetyltransferase [Paraburkholderia humisilvae]CAB3754341.1 hypothetical protein LMG29542_02321 [Paraburkholderia humisilvae]
MLSSSSKSRERERDEVVAFGVQSSARAGNAMETNRLALRPLRREDANLLHPHVTDNVTRLWIGWDTPKSLADTEASVVDALARIEQGHYAGWLAHSRFRDSKGAAPFVGFVSLERLLEPVRGAWFELNFWLTESQWGKGYAHEMASVVLDWTSTRTDLRLVTLSWTHGNEGSRTVIERLVDGQQPEERAAVKSAVELPVYHYVVNLDRWHRQQAHRRHAYL